MVTIQQDGAEICAKILYVGPKQAGKTTNLRSLVSLNSPEVQSGTHQLQFYLCVPSLHVSPDYKKRL